MNRLQPSVMQSDGQVPNYKGKSQKLWDHPVENSCCQVKNWRTEVFPCFFLSCKANARVILAKTGHGPHSSSWFLFCCYSFCCFMGILCYSMYILYYFM
jgi:hypothetical protein